MQSVMSFAPRRFAVLAFAALLLAGITACQSSTVNRALNGFGLFAGPAHIKLAQAQSR